MTVTFKYESRTDYFGTTLWCEEYADKHSGFKKFWRWGVDNKTCGDLLSSKPNMNRLMKTYLANGEIEVETNTVDSVHKAFNGEGKIKRYTIQNNLSESFKPMKRVDEGFIDDIRNKFGKRLEKQVKKDIEYTPDNNKGIYSVDDILMLISKRFQNKFEQFLIEASRWGKARNNNYREKQEGDLCPVAYDRGKFYTKTNLDGWTLVPFKYRQLSF